MNSNISQLSYYFIKKIKICAYKTKATFIKKLIVYVKFAQSELYCFYMLKLVRNSLSIYTNF